MAGRSALVRTVASRPRLVAATALGLAVGLLLPADLRGSSRVLLGWIAGVLTWLVLATIMMVRSDEAGMQTRADEDTGAIPILLLSVAAAVASFAAIVVELNSVKEAAGPDKAVAISIVAATILLSWLFLHAMFAIHYAHEFYGGPPDDPKADRRGLEIPGTDTPDYWDFMYFSVTIGAAAQTSDIDIDGARMRRLVLAHTVVSFIFNTTVLALAINVGASLI